MVWMNDVISIVDIFVAYRVDGFLFDFLASLGVY